MLAAAPAATATMAMMSAAAVSIEHGLYLCERNCRGPAKVLELNFREKRGDGRKARRRAWKSFSQKLKNSSRSMPARSTRRKKIAAQDVCASEKVARSRNSRDRYVLDRRLVVGLLAELPAEARHQARRDLVADGHLRRRCRSRRRLDLEDVEAERRSRRRDDRLGEEARRPAPGAHRELLLLAADSWLVEVLNTISDRMSD